MTTNPGEVTLTSRGSAVIQRVIAGVSAAATAGVGVAIAFSDQAWWAITLWELGILVVVLIMLAIGSSAKESAKETIALQAAGKVVQGEVLDTSSHDNGEDRTYEITFWIPLPDGGFEALHRCSGSCADLGTGARLTVLVDPQAHNFAIVH